MEQKKPKMIKIRDLKPTKDAKGGHGHGGGGYGIRRVQLGMGFESRTVVRSHGAIVY